MSNYLDTVTSVYARAADHPDADLCCTAAPLWRLPDLRVPPIMLEMNYGCGSTVDPRDLGPADTVVYVGVGGGLEALQFAYCTRRPGAVIAIDPVPEMRARARANFAQAADLNPWFDPSFVDIRAGTALDLPLLDASASVLAQNCLFNVFTADDLRLALAEAARVLKLGGLFATSDPVTQVPLPPQLSADSELRARCLTGCQTLSRYLEELTAAGFGRVEVRARFPYRLLSPHQYRALTEPILLETVQAAAFKLPESADGPAIFTGRTAIYQGPQETLDDGQGNILPRGLPVPVSDAAAKRMSLLDGVLITQPTWHYRGGGCC
jgi:SAM-dependent methyltransferase